MTKLTGNVMRSAEQRERRHRTQPRRGLSAVEAATYLGVQHSKFEALVKQGRLPKPRLIDKTQVWDIDELDIAFDQFPSKPAEAPPKQPWEYGPGDKQ